MPLDIVYVSIIITCKSERGDFKMENLIYLAPAMGVVALLFAIILIARVNKQDAGTDRMKEIADAISSGAKAFLISEYKMLVVFAAIVFLGIGFGLGNWITAVCFLVGGLQQYVSFVVVYSQQSLDTSE